MSARKVLVVDDNDNVRSFLILLLEQSSRYETLEAATGEEAVEKAISGRPDVILINIILPGINGVDATKAIRNNPSTSQIPIIAYSALPLVGWKEQALKAGMVAYLQKPFNLQLLMETIQKHPVLTLTKEEIETCVGSNLSWSRRSSSPNGRRMVT